MDDLVKTKVKLQSGESLVLRSSTTKGTLQEMDVDNFDIVDQSGNVVGTVTYTNHTAIKGFKRTQTLLQRDSKGSVVIDESW